MKIKIVYVATAPVYQTDKRGNTKVLPVGHELAPKAYDALTANQKAKFARVEKTVGGRRFAGGVARDLPVVDGVVKTVFVPGEYHLLPVMVHDLVNEVTPQWEAAYPEIPFPGVYCGRYQADGHLTWFIHSGGLPANAAPMFTTSNHLCAPLAKRDRKPGTYLYRGAALLKVAERLRAGRPVFASSEEAIARALEL